MVASSWKEKMLALHHLSSVAAFVNALEMWIRQKGDIPIQVFPWRDIVFQLALNCFDASKIKSRPDKSLK